MHTSVLCVQVCSRSQSRRKKCGAVLVAVHLLSLVFLLLSLVPGSFVCETPPWEVLSGIKTPLNMGGHWARTTRLSLEQDGLDLKFYFCLLFKHICVGGWWWVCVFPHFFSVLIGHTSSGSVIMSLSILKQSWDHLWHHCFRLVKRSSRFLTCRFLSLSTQRQAYTHLHTRILPPFEGR